MTEQTNPALADTPKANVGGGEVRGRLSIALTIHGAEIDELSRIALATAIGQISPVDVCASAFDAFVVCMDQCGPVLASRAIEIAEIIAEHQFHGKGDAAATFAATYRATLFPSQPEPDPGE